MTNLDDDNQPFSMLIHAIERDLERSPEGNGGEVYYFPATEKHGGIGHSGEYLLKEWQEVTADLKASTQMHEQARLLLDQTLTDRDRALDKLSDAEEDLGNEIRNHEITKNELDKAWTKIHFADHGPHCSSGIAVPEGPKYACDCWKSHP